MEVIKGYSNRKWGKVIKLQIAGEWRQIMWTFKGHCGTSVFIFWDGKLLKSFFFRKGIPDLTYTVLVWFLYWYHILGVRESHSNNPARDDGGLNKGSNHEEREWWWDGHTEWVKSDHYENKELPNILNIRCERGEKRNRGWFEWFWYKQSKKAAIYKDIEDCKRGKYRRGTGNSVSDMLSLRYLLDTQAGRMSRQLQI